MKRSDIYKRMLVASGVLYLPAHNDHRELAGRRRMVRRCKKRDRRFAAREVADATTPDLT